MCCCIAKDEVEGYDNNINAFLVSEKRQFSWKRTEQLFASNNIIHTLQNVELVKIPLLTI